MNEHIFSDIKPYVRYARYMTLDSSAVFPSVIPCDARLFYVTEGVGAISVQGKAYTMSSGDLLILNSGIEYKLCAPTDSVTYFILNFDYLWECSNLCIPIPPVNAEDFSMNMLIERIIFRDAQELNAPIYIPGVFGIVEKCSEIEREFSQKVMMYETRISGILSTVLVDCLRVCRTKEFAKGHEKLEEILRYIHSNYRANLTNKTIGERFGFHPNYISSIIKNYTGMSLHKYLIYVRISRAAELLNSTGLSVGEIAERCGFCDIFYFSRYFKQYMNSSPLEYRNKNNGI